ncbi:hypothetical protein PPUN12996_11040 [Pseudomonas putida]|nr:hypothetical protein PPUN12996_11040 [Pseudomonas putida]
MIQLHDVDLKLLRVFTTIVRCGGFSAAQAALNAGQSTILNLGIIDSDRPLSTHCGHSTGLRSPST